MLVHLRQRAQKLKTETYALYLAYRDPRTPWYAKVWAVIVVAYALSPIDLIPDFIPVLGYLDDLVLVPVGIALALKMIPPVVMEETRQNAQGVEAPGNLIYRIGVVLVVLIWVALAGLGFFIIWHIIR